MPPKPQPWPADQVERRPVASLIGYARNARTHSPAQVDQIAAAIREWGWTNAVLVAEDNTILAGHGRVLAAQKLGLTDIPVMVARGWSEAQRRAYVLADNKIALNAGWDEHLLKIDLADLQADDFNLVLTGFAPGELADFIGGRDIGPPSQGGTPVDDPAGEWEGMPEFNNPNNCHRKVIVNFQDADAVERFFDLLQQSCTENTKSIWFPHVEPRDLEGSRYSTGE